ncbi:MAG: hypothetical protein BWY87_01571 [Deltaproteobacteria bacterium ADurb.Bin510]|nr:MAG: hypothetical protein BWY87_01571 [Deltaproteobacteria bacterium ADurb.Bin510]
MDCSSSIGGYSRPPSSISAPLTRPRGPSRAWKPAATTTVGSTKGTVASAFSRRLPLNSKRANTKAAGSPSARARPVETAASQKVNQTMCR